MKGRLTRLIITLCAVNTVAALLVLSLGYAAGTNAPQAGFFDWGARTRPADYQFLLALAFALIVPAVTFLFTLNDRVLKPLHDLTEFSEKLGNGEYRVKVAIDRADDFG